MTTTLEDLCPARWTIQHPDRMQLYSAYTPNGVKIPIALEELGLPYEAHRVDIGSGHQLDDDYVVINPNAKIPTLVDPDGPDGAPIALMESGAILMYLADKTGVLLPDEPRLRWEAIQWSVFQSASVGPMFGQYRHFSDEAKGKTDGYGEARYQTEVRRLLHILAKRLDGRDFLVGESLSIADIATAPWVVAVHAWGAAEEVGLHELPAIAGWIERLVQRPAFQRGLAVYR